MEQLKQLIQADYILNSIKTEVKTLTELTSPTIKGKLFQISTAGKNMSMTLKKKKIKVKDKFSEYVHYFSRECGGVRQWQFPCCLWPCDSSSLMGWRGVEFAGCRIWYIWIYIKLSTKQKQLLWLLFFFLNASLDFATVLFIISVSCAHTCISVTIEEEVEN